MYSNCTKTRVWELCSEWRGCKYFLKKFKLSLTQGYKCGAPRYRSLREQYYSPLHPKLWLKVTLVWHKINSLMHSVRIEFSSSNLLRDELAINIFHFFFFFKSIPFVRGDDSTMTQWATEENEKIFEGIRNPNKR